MRGRINVGALRPIVTSVASGAGVLRRTGLAIGHACRAHVGEISVVIVECSHGSRGDKVVVPVEVPPSVAS